MRISDWSSDVCSSDLDEARRRKLAGTLVISVAIRRDGSVERADMIQSSGIKLLDAAAMRIAKLAEPYPPLPRTEEKIDVRHVTNGRASCRERVCQYVKLSVVAASLKQNKPH